VKFVLPWRRKEDAGIIVDAVAADERKIESWASSGHTTVHFKIFGQFHMQPLALTIATGHTI
jgi:hypothetical protein